MKEKGNVRNLIPAAMLVLVIVTAAIPLAGASYNRYAATQYALDHALSPNPAYPYFSEDCTNFASQVLTAGGWPQTGIDYASSNAWFYWFGHTPGYSYTWAVANNLNAFLISHSDRATPLAVTHPYYAKFKQGDLVQFDFYNTNHVLVPDGRWDHTMIVVGVLTGDADDLILAGHTDNTKTTRLSDIKTKYPNTRYIGWSIK